MQIAADCYAGRHSTTSSDAVSCFEQAVRALATHQPLASALQHALRLDPDLTAALALQGLGAALLGRAKGFELAKACLPAAQAALAKAGGGTTYERALVDAHAAAAGGFLARAAQVLERHVELHPSDFLAVRLAHALRFMTGEPRRMLSTLDMVLPHWSHRDPGYGFLVGCRAFALEETGSLEEAEVAGRMAVMHEPEDVWGLHAVAHVMEMSGRAAEGKSWLSPTRGHWSKVGVFGQHLAWHLALFHLSQGDSEGALALFDSDLAPAPDGDFRDVANAVSLLWRLEQEGVDVGDRWCYLHDIGYGRRRDCALAFASLHYLLALVAKRDLDAADELIAALRHTALSGDHDQAVVAARVGVTLAETIVAASRRREVSVALPALAARLQLLGGSHAQRDVFLRTLIAVAADAGDFAAVQSLTMMRLQERRMDRFHELIERRAAKLPVPGRIKAETAIRPMEVM